MELLSQSGCSLQVIRHCKTVSSIAIQIANTCRERGFDVDMRLVEIGALLHDIGRSRTHSVDHVIIGAEIAKSLDLPEPIISIIERHAGGGISVEEAEELEWPVKSYIPETLEEKIVTYADKLVEGGRKVPIEQTIKKHSRKLGETHQSIRRLRELHREFSRIIGDCDDSSCNT
ncbi:MAG: TIGR00295 family protein [Candidatus Bathyarchaeota archaeon]|nr:MAG: TIGR00295 family protein [Candidatus Bathyarchaeota archaeon]